MLNTIWSSAKSMYLMALSQIFHYKLECDLQEFEATEVQNTGFLSYMEDFIKPFEIQMSQNNV